jgi:hypothetical protein
LVVRFVAMIPGLRYKDRAMVTLAPSKAQAPQVNPTQNTQGQPTQIENDKVLTH